MYQKIIVLGNLGGDPEMRYMPDGQAVTNFSLAVNKTWSDRESGEKKKVTTWFRIAAWGRMAETANQYLSKGSAVLVEGEMKPDPSTGSPKMFTRKDGTESCSFDINPSRIQFVNSQGHKQEYTDQQAQAQETEEDEIPF